MWQSPRYRSTVDAGGTLVIRGTKRFQQAFHVRLPWELSQQRRGIAKDEDQE